MKNSRKLDEITSRNAKNNQKQSQNLIDTANLIITNPQNRICCSDTMLQFIQVAKRNKNNDMNNQANKLKSIH